MSQQALLTRVVETLERCGAGYMVTGSFASSLQGEPRSTHDIDLVVTFENADPAELLRSFPPPDFYLSDVAIRDAVRDRSMFNLLSTRDGDKVDFWLLTDTPFDRSRFARRRVENVFGLDLCVSAPEDTILAKLDWAKRSGGSERQLTDALRVYEVQGSALDEKHLDDWARKLGVEELLAKLRAAADSL